MDALSPAYPIARPDSGDDARFCLGLALDIGAVLTRYGYPPVHTAADVSRLHQALFGFIYQETS
jgi:hypothetical protein